MELPLFYSLLLAGVIIVVGYAARWLLPPTRLIERFLCQLVAFAGFTIMLLAARVVPSAPTPVLGQTSAFLTVSAFKLVWWLALSWLIVGFVHTIFHRQLRETRLAQDLIAGIAYTCTAVAIIAYVFDLPVQGLLTASGLIAIVLGLALQSTLGDVFSGIMINVSKPYRLGDWVIIDDSLQGRVVETNWRSTQVLTGSNDLAAVPNSVVAKSKLVNASYPAKAHGITITVRLEPAMAPARECVLLETALLGCNKILRTPPPSVSVLALDALAMECELDFFVATIEDTAAAKTEVFDLVYRHCTTAGIRLAMPPGSPVALPPGGTREPLEATLRRLLERLPLFAPLSEDERVSLVAKMKLRSYKPGEIVLAPESVAKALAIVASGVLVTLQDAGPGKGEVEVVRLNPGDCYGQSDVLTGAPSVFTIKTLTRTTVYEITKDDLLPVLKERPAIAAELGYILSRRAALGEKILENQIDQEIHEAGLADWFTSRIKALFNLK